MICETHHNIQDIKDISRTFLSPCLQSKEHGMHRVKSTHDMTLSCFGVAFNSTLQSNDGVYVMTRETYHTAPIN